MVLWCYIIDSFGGHMSKYIFEAFYQETSLRCPRIIYGPFDTEGQAVEYAEAKTGFEWQSLTSFGVGTIQDWMRRLHPRGRKANR